ncbi:MAG: hypothetical protein HUK15_05440 [Bacteroidales bacterium]|nr:hypothetical protein [Bacteroidales bacterium]
MRHVLDIRAIFENIPAIIGLQELSFRGGKWEGQYYINGERHPNKRDKIRIWIWNSNVMIGEQGGESMTIQKWLYTYGGCTDWKDVFSRLDAQEPMETPIISRERNSKETIYVDREIWKTYAEYDYSTNNLYCYLKVLFGEKRAFAVWNKYMMTDNGKGSSVFWYIDSIGRIYHDKVISYQRDGHRNKKYGAWRKFKSSDGYNGRCLFGDHLANTDKEICVVESEKTALICACVWDGVIFLATGGKSKISGIKTEWNLLPDIDAVKDWEVRGKVIRWWEGWKSAGEKSDIGDMIELYIKYGKLSTLRKEEVKNKILFGR